MAKRLMSFLINDAEADGLRMVKAVDGIAVSELIRQAIRDSLDQRGVMWRPADRGSGPTRPRTRSPRPGGVR